MRKIFSEIFAVVAHLDACIYYLICKRTSRWLGHAGDLEHYVSFFYSQRFIKGQVEEARQKKAKCSLFYSEKYS